MLSEAGKHYGESIIKKYSIKLITEVNKKYNETNLKRMRQFYWKVEKGATVWHQLSWSHYRLLITLVTIEEINYYSKTSVENLYSVRELEEKIKSKEHEERMKTEREDRKKKFNVMLDNSKNVVADELLFTATNRFFKNMSNEDLMKWANTCMEFVYEDLGYTKEQILHSTLHLDEKTPHIHCVVVPLIKKFDKRTNTERYTISKKQYIKDKIHLSQLQDKYHKRLTEKGFDLERGIKGSDNVNINIRELKKITRKLNVDLNNKTQRLSESVKDLQDKMKSNKNVLFDKEYAKIKKDTFDTMNKVIDDATNVMNLQPKLENVYKEVDSYTKSYQSLKRENTLYEKEIKVLEFNNNKLNKKNTELTNKINSILKVIKKFFKKVITTW